MREIKDMEIKISNFLIKLSIILLRKFKETNFFISKK